MASQGWEPGGGTRGDAQGRLRDRQRYLLMTSRLREQIGQRSTAVTSALGERAPTERMDSALKDRPTHAAQQKSSVVREYHTMSAEPYQRLRDRRLMF